mmetsp:Transcript_17316/g.34466  ORF Transcript_17316/g.34466 Transcript_17316/m.34466 type:complete len:323 (-) Transcript_17316:1060-2028(-)
MVEQSHSSVHHDHPVLLARCVDRPVLHAPTRLYDVADPHLGSVIDGVPERKERVAAHGDARRLLHELVLIALLEWLRHGLELCLPAHPLLRREVPLDVPDAGVDAILSLDSRFKLQREHLGVLAHVPRGDLASGEFDAVNARLLSGADSHHHTVLGEPNGVGLGVFDADGGDYHVPGDVVGNGVRAVHDVHVVARDDGVVTFLGKSHAVNLPVFHLGGGVSFGGFENNEFPPLLGFENCQRLRGVPRRHDTVADFLFEDHRRLLVHDVAHRRKIPEGTHGIGVSRPQICEGHWSESISGLPRHLVRRTLPIRERDSHGRTGG